MSPAFLIVLILTVTVIVYLLAFEMKGHPPESEVPAAPEEAADDSACKKLCGDCDCHQAQDQPVPVKAPSVERVFYEKLEVPVEVKIEEPKVEKLTVAPQPVPQPTKKPKQAPKPKVKKEPQVVVQAPQKTRKPKAPAKQAKKQNLPVNEFPTSKRP